jgi:uncharacterized protein YgiM (DUF1202 family)
MMKTRLLIVILLLCAAGALIAADQKQRIVTVKTTQVRATASYLGTVVGNLNYGDLVTLLDQPADAPKDWLKVLGPDKKLQGWVNASAIKQTNVALKSSSGQVSQSASSGDVALAGKGFNSDVEKQYKENEHLDYTWVDTMEHFEIAPQEVSLFLSQGGLTEPGGAK